MKTDLFKKLFSSLTRATINLPISRLNTGVNSIGSCLIEAAIDHGCAHDLTSGLAAPLTTPLNQFVAIHTEYIRRKMSWNYPWSGY